MCFPIHEDDNIIIRKEYLKMTASEIEKREAAMKEHAVAEAKAATLHDKSISWIKL